MARSMKFVTDHHGLHWLSRPTSWIKGWIEHRWFERHTGIAKQASPDYFRDLAVKFGTRTIEQDDRGDITVTPPPPPAVRSPK